MQFNDDEEPRCECGDPECDASVDRAEEACMTLGKMVNDMVNVIVVANGLNRRETHMMMGMLLGRMTAQGVLNTLDRYGVENANQWLTIMMHTIAEAVEFETPHQILITTEVREQEG